jgi:DNA-binding helix-hairpin-helix protein with protein kinase domain
MANVELYNNAKGTPSRIEIEDKPLKSGGEGTVFRSKDGLWVIKIYHPGKVKPEKRQFLEKITEVGAYLSKEEEQFLCWPKGIVQTVNGHSKIGCLTRYIPLPKLSDMNQSRFAAERQIKSGKSWSHYLQIARGVARTVTTLQKYGAVHADLSNNNFFVNPENCDVVLFDLDGIIIEGGHTQGDVIGTKGMIAREIMLKEARPNKLSERHSLAVQILLTLLFRNVFKPLITYDETEIEKDDDIGWGLRLTFSEDPRDKQNRPKNLGLPLTQDGELSYKMLSPGLRKLTERACIDGLRNPVKRPSAEDWIKTLSYALDELCLCQRCHLHFPYPHWIQSLHERSCPFCGQSVRNNPHSVISIYEPNQRGKYLAAQRYLVMNDGWLLFEDVLDSPSPPMSRKREARAGHVIRDEKRSLNYIINDEGSPWISQVGSNRTLLKVGKGESIPLLPGTIINTGENRRLFVVME